MLLGSAVLSLVLHAAVLSARVSPVGSKRVVNGSVGSSASTAIRVRTVSLLPPSPLPSPVRESPQVNEAIHAPDRAPVAASAQEPSTDSSPAAAAPALSVTAEADSDSYVPRSQLSTPPIAKTAIVLESPPNEIGAGRLVGVLSLFIDEQGRVQLIEAEEPALPPAFEQAAREAFMGAEFSPGEVGGRAVKSHQRVEVVFDTITTSRRGEVEMPD